MKNLVFAMVLLLSVSGFSRLPDEECDSRTSSSVSFLQVANGSRFLEQLVSLKSDQEQLLLRLGLITGKANPAEMQHYSQHLAASALSGNSDVLRRTERSCDRHWALDQFQKAHQIIIDLRKQLSSTTVQ